MASTVDTIVIMDMVDTIGDIGIMAIVGMDIITIVDTKIDLINIIDTITTIIPVTVIIIPVDDIEIIIIRISPVLLDTYFLTAIVIRTCTKVKKQGLPTQLGQH